MPTKGWAGLTASDNSQATAIAAVMKKFTDEGIEVWLRFAHEVNYYQTDGTYQGTAADFKAGWAAVAAAVKSNPKVKMFFTPNIADLKTYQEFYPTDVTTVDLIGVDYYPAAGAGESEFLSAMQGFHDAYCLNKSHATYFCMGETGLKETGTVADKLNWLAGQTSSNVKAKMPKMIGTQWFNYIKSDNGKDVVDFRIWNSSSTDDATTKATKAWMADGTTSTSIQV
ncbi:hypothetical protein T439DRAFT_252227 [Meredithblackwellia eburnea MCA 4105]